MRQQTGASERRQYSNRREQVSAGNTATGRSRSAPAIQRQAGTGQHQQYSDRQEQVSTSNTTGRSRLAPAIQQPPGTGRLRRPLSVRRNKKSAQPDATNTAAYRHLPIHYPIPQRRTATCPERGSARGKSGLRNSERLSPSQTCPRQSVPPKGKELHCQSVPPLERNYPSEDTGSPPRSVRQTPDIVQYLVQFSHYFYQ